MRKFIVIFFVSAVWIAAHVAYFFYYQRLLQLPFTAVSAGFAILWSAWMLSLMFCFRSWPSRMLILGLYVFFLGWSVVNFAYFQVFQNFLSLSPSRIMSANAAMIDLLRDFYVLVAPSIAAAALGLLALFFAISSWSGKRRKRGLPVMFFAGGTARFGSKSYRRSYRLAVAGLIAQVMFGSVATEAVAGYRERFATNGAGTNQALADLGVFGYALAARRGSVGQAAAAVHKPESASGAGAALRTSKTNFEALRESLDRLAASEPAAPPTQPARAFKKPPDIIVYQIESAAYWPLEQPTPVMPFLDSLIKQYGSAGKYFSNGCTTIDAELAVNCSFLPDTFGPVSDLYSKNDYRCLPTLLKERGYTATMYHSNLLEFWNRNFLAPSWGFDGLHFRPEFVFRQPDSEIFDRVIDEIKKSDTPGYHYVIGMTSHAPHDEYFQKYYKKKFNLDVPAYAGYLNEVGKLISADEETTRRYLGFMKADDDGIRRLFARLQDEGLLDNTIVVIFGDHRYYDNAIADPYRRFIEYNRLPFLLYVPGMGKLALPEIASHIDIAPTLYKLVAGADDLPASFLGTDLLSPAHRSFAITKCLGRMSYYDGSTLVESDAVLGSDRIVSSPDGPGAPDPQLATILRSVGFMTDLALRRNELAGSRAGRMQPASRTLRFDEMTDSDHDGLSDLREAGIGTDPHIPDSDGDGFKDGDEVLHGYNPLGPGKWIRKQ